MAANRAGPDETTRYCSFDGREEKLRKSIDKASAKAGESGALGRLVANAGAGAGRMIERVLRKETPPAASTVAEDTAKAPANPTVFHVELEAIQKRREHNGLQPAGISGLASPSTMHKLTGLCLSGGGLRSATFSLGVMQALFLHGGKRNDKLGHSSDLPMIDYVSGVSGGNYIASCLSLGMTRSDGRFPFADGDNSSTETPTTRHLRDNSRYLVAGGIFSIVSFLFVYLRGLVAGLMCILPPLVAFAAGMAWMFPDPWALESPPWAFGGLLGAYDTGYIPVLSLVAGLVLFGLALLAIVYSLWPPIRSVSKKAIIAGLVAAVLGGPLLIILLIEGHPALLRAYYVSDKTLLPPTQGVALLSVTAEKLRIWAQTVAPFIVAIVALALPFIKQIAETAAKTTQASMGGKIASILSRITLPVLAFIVPFLLWLFMMVMAITMIDKGYFLFEGATPARWFVGACVVFLISLFVIDYNVNSLHNIYRDRMSRAFLVSAKALSEPDETRRKQQLHDDDSMKLSEISTDHAPYHLINTALNIPGSAWANQRGRNADFFVYSPNFIGGELTGYVNTKYAEERVPVFNLGSAMAVSGAAIAPNMGMLSVRMMSLTLAVLNLRLGRWAANPRRLGRESSSKFLDFPGGRHFLREAFNKTGIGSPDNGRGETGAAIASGADKPFVYLSDGGHIENLGAYELLRRRCRLVICVDGECDPDISAGALAQLERFARIDLNIRLHIDVAPIAIRHQAASKAMSKETEPLRPEETHAGPHVALGMIEYPATVDGPGAEIGAFLYVKSSLSGDENAYVAAYKAEHPAFPHETTGDQFFSEEQFECYRALGEHILRRALAGKDPVTVPSHFIEPRQQRQIIRIVEESLPGTKIKVYAPEIPKPATQGATGSKPRARKRVAEAVKAAAKSTAKRPAAKSSRTAKS